MSDKCVFCGRPSSEARFMVKGPGDKNLCNDCISVVSIIANQAMLSMDNIEVGGDPWENAAPPKEDFDDIFGGEEFPFDIDDFEEELPFPSEESKGEIECI